MGKIVAEGNFGTSTFVPLVSSSVPAPGSLIVNDTHGFAVFSLGLQLFCAAIRREPTLKVIQIRFRIKKLSFKKSEWVPGE